MKVAEMRGPLLRSVSRSFYLSIRILPAKLRDPIALAYLLARATDTIADTAEVEREIRLRELERLAALIQENDAGLTSNHSFVEFASRQANDDERALLAAIPQCLNWLREIDEADRGDIRSVLLRINQGQRLDVERFRNPAQIVALENAAELDRYTYLVAGSVGEFWTNICFRHLPNFANRSPQEMHSLGIDYGKGLQLVNILRDLGTDLRGGRCYLPAEELHSLGMLPAALKTEPERAAKILSVWLERAESGLKAGLDYACAIRPWRVRLATALPALIGARTIALLKFAGTDVFSRRVKISRHEVRRIIFAGLTTLAAPRALRAAFKSHLENIGAASR